MKIKQVEELVGITQKNIRFYEEQGLLKVERAENGYREYSLEDVNTLKKIRLLRLISVPIEDIKLLFANKKSLDDILEAQISYLDNQKESMEKMKSFCSMLLNQNLTLDNMNVSECLENIEQLEKEGMQFMDIKNTDVRLKKKLGALLGFSVIMIFMLIGIIPICYAAISGSISMSDFIIVLIIPLPIIVGLFIALIQRNKEIEGGEEDEASKY